MRKPYQPIPGAGAALLLVALLGAPPTSAQTAGQAPEKKVCDDKANPPKDAVTQGGCIVIERAKGNCMACHRIAGTTSGDIAPALVNMQQRYQGEEGRKKLRAQINDARQFNPRTVMPPFGAHEILSQDEIGKVVEFVLSL